MRILIFSDSHGKSDNMNAVLSRLAPNLDMVIHLGDNVSDVAGLKSKYSNLPFHTVLGNCDYSGDSDIDAIIEASGKKIFIAHGHSYDVKLNPQRMVYAADEREADICLYGHTHIPVIFAEASIIFMNPGSISLPRDSGPPSYGVISIENNNSYISVVSVKKNGFELRYSMEL